eukprot:tig00021493_g21899.t1
MLRAIPQFSIHRPMDVLRGSIDFFAAAGLSAAVAYGTGTSSSASSDPGAGAIATPADPGSSFTVSEGRDYGNAYTVHAVAMAITWAVIVPASIFIVRHLKHIPIWLNLHRGMMQLALTITVPAASAAFASRATGAEAKSHGLLGLALAIDSALQLALGMLVKHFHMSRKPQRWAHAVRTLHRANGWLVCLGALANVGLGQQLMMPVARNAFILWLAVLVTVFALGEAISFYNWRRVEVIFDSINVKKVAHITPSEFERAIRLGSQWVLVGDRVFDLAPIMSSHPGGTALLHSVIGQDVSAFLYGSGGRMAFGGYRAHHHSVFAHRMLQDLCVAVLHPEGDRDDEAAVAEVQTWTVVERTVVCPSNRPIYRVRFACDVTPFYQDDLRYLGQHFEVTANINGRDVHRHYSLVRIAHAGGARAAPTRARRYSVDPDGELDYSATHDLWLRRYPTGAMSRYLLDAPMGSSIRVRGPLGLGLRLGHDTEGDLVAVVAGTGILPLLDLVAHIRRTEDEHAAQVPPPRPPPLPSIPPLPRPMTRLGAAGQLASPVLGPRQGPEPAALRLPATEVSDTDREAAARARARLRR